MQKVVGASPIIRSIGKPRSGGVFHCDEPELYPAIAFDSQPLVSLA